MSHFITLNALYRGCSGNTVGELIVPDKEQSFITRDIFSKICSHFVTAAEISVPTCNA